MRCCRDCNKETERGSFESGQDSSCKHYISDAIVLSDISQFDNAVKAICKSVMPDHPLPSGEAPWQHFKTPMARPDFIGNTFASLNEAARQFALNIMQQFIGHDAAGLRMVSQYLTKEAIALT